MYQPSYSSFVPGAGRRGNVMRALLAFVLVLFFFLPKSFAAPRFAVTSGNWNGPIWATTAGGVAGSAATPTSSDAVGINAGVVVGVNVTASAASVQISGTLNFNSGVNLTISNAGFFNVGGTGVVSFDATSRVLGGGFNANGIVVVFNAGSSVSTANVDGFMAGTTNAAISTGSIGVNRGSRGGPTYSGDLTYNASGAQDIGTGPVTIVDLNVNTTGTLTASAAFSSTGVVTIDPAATLDMSTFTLTLAGSGAQVANNGTFTSNSTVSYVSNSAQTIGNIDCRTLNFTGTGAKTMPAGADINITNWGTGTAAITMNTTASLTVSNAVYGSAAITMGSGTLTISGLAFSNTGTFNRGTGTVVYDRAGTQTVRNVTYNNLTLRSSGLKTTTGVTVNGGTLSMEGTATLSAAPTYSGAATLVYNTATGRTAGNEWLTTTTATGGVVISNTGTIAIGATKTFTGAPLTIMPGATFSAGASGITTNDDFINNGTWVASSNNFTVTGTVAQSIGSFNTTGALVSTKTAGTATLTGNVNMRMLNMNTAGGTLNLGAGTHDVSGNVVLTAGTLNGGTAVMTVGNSWTGTGTVFVPAGSTIDFDGAGQTLSASGAKTFYNLVYSGSGNKNVSAGTLVVNNTFTIQDAAIPTGTTVTYGTNAALLYDNASARTVGAEWITPFVATGGVTISTTGTIALNANKVFTGAPFIIKPNGVFNAGNFDMSFSGDFTNDGTWTGNTGDVTVTGTAGQSIGGFSTTGLFLMSKTGGTATLSADVNMGSFNLNGNGGTLDFGTGHTLVCAGIFTSTAGTINANNSTLVFDNTVAALGGTFNAGTGTAHFRGSGAQSVPGINWYNLVFSNTGPKSFSGNANVFNVMTVNSGATVNMGTILLQLGGTGAPLVNDGTINTGTSTIGYAGSGSQIVTPLNYYNLSTDVGGGARTLSTTGTIGIGGLFTPGTASYTVAGSTVDFNGGADQNIPAFTFDKLIVSNNGIKKILAAVIVQCQTIDINDAASVEIDADGAGKLNVMQ